VPVGAWAIPIGASLVLSFNPLCDLARGPLTFEARGHLWTVSVRRMVTTTLDLHTDPPQAFDVWAYRDEDFAEFERCAEKEPVRGSTKSFFACLSTLARMPATSSSDGGGRCTTVPPLSHCASATRACRCGVT